LLCADVCCAICCAAGVQKDWIVVLSAGDRQWLADMNSAMTQIDLASKSLAPALAGILFDVMSYGGAAVLMMFLNAAVTVAFFWFLSCIYRDFPALWSRNTGGGGSGEGGKGQGQGQGQGQEVESGEAASSSIEMTETGAGAGAETETDRLLSIQVPAQQEVCIEESPSTMSSGSESGAGGAGGSRLGGRAAEFLSSGCVATMVSYSALYFTVLSFGSLMTVYLKGAGMSVSWIGTLRGIGALTGFLGAFVFPAVQRRLGLVATGVYAIWYQLFFVSLAASSLYWASPLAATFVISVAVLLSRTGLWMFDLAATQIAQLRIPEHSRGRVNGQWRSLTAFFDTLTYVVAILFCSPDSFVVLCSLSAVSVAFAATFFTVAESERFVQYWTGAGAGTGAGGWSLSSFLGHKYSPIPDSPSASHQSERSGGSGGSSQKSVELLIPTLE
jgi:iron-regulated transporter 1